MKLTRKKALEICRDLWRWLASSQYTSKREWSGWDKLPDMAYDCPCCQYVRNKTGELTLAGMPCAQRDVTGDELFSKCVALCPLGSLWPDGCQSPHSPFAKWNLGRNVKANATLIANAASAELAKMRRKKKK